MPQFAHIALPVPLDRTFTYTIPAECAGDIALGKRVLVPFGRNYLTGVVVGFADQTDVKGLKPVRDVLDAVPSFADEMLHLTKWMGEYYFAPWGEVLRAATPQGLSQESKRTVHLLQEPAAGSIALLKKKAPTQFAIVEQLRLKGPLTVNQLADRTRVKTIHAAVHALAGQGWVRIEETISTAKAKPKREQAAEVTNEGRAALAGSALKERQRALLAVLTEQQTPQSVVPLLRESRASLSTLRTLAKKGFVRMVAREVPRVSPYDIIEAPPDITPNPAQIDALTAIAKAADAGAYSTFLLHGVTGSGKTQVYIDAIRNVLTRGKTAIVLVPEIALTPQTVRRFTSHFGPQVAVMHSQMSIGERYDAWRNARDGKVRIVIGPRSAIFAPLANIGLIVVDEEHESSYKQYDATPRYNARDVAIVRAVRTNAVVVLGSATPSVESYYNAVTGKYRLLELPERVDDARMPAIEIVDIATERRRQYEAIKADVKATGKDFPKRLPDTSVSKPLADQIRDRLQKREGVILLQNRRGFSHVVECYDCGFVERCENCDVSLTYHMAKRHLRCHYCGIVKKPPSVCGKCGSSEVRMHAFGTQQVEEELRSLFPEAVVLRMDRDTTSRKGSHDRILSQFGNGGADILLGTQMVAKGLDFPRVTLVGVISADTQMLLPDFRASEGTFQLLTQVSGRAGRSTLPGEVVIQTLQPGHYSLKHVLTHDYRGFYEEEIKYRKELDYPPFSRIALIEFSSVSEDEVLQHARQFTGALTKRNTSRAFVVLGPADAAIPRLRGQYRKHVVVKDLRSADPGGSLLRMALLGSLQEYSQSPLSRAKNVRMVIDIDPQGMM